MQRRRLPKTATVDDFDTGERREDSKRHLQSFLKRQEYHQGTSAIGPEEEDEYAPVIIEETPQRPSTPRTTGPIDDEEEEEGWLRSQMAKAVGIKSRMPEDALASIPSLEQIEADISSRISRAQSQLRALQATIAAHEHKLQSLTERQSSTTPGAHDRGEEAERRFMRQLVDFFRSTLDDDRPPLDRQLWRDWLADWQASSPESFSKADAASLYAQLFPSSAATTESDSEEEEGSDDSDDGTIREEDL